MSNPLQHKIFDDIKQLFIDTRKQMRRSVIYSMVVTNREIGRIIVEEEHHGKGRAKYGNALLKTLSTLLIDEFGRGYNYTHLNYCRQLFTLFPIQYAMSTESQ